MVLKKVEYTIKVYEWIWNMLIITNAYEDILLFVIFKKI